MLLIKSQTNNPYLNIATEEFLLKNTSEDLIFFYRNAPSVIIGKHQVHNIEVNLPFVTEHKIPVIRRISGGGSVFHDENNLNYAIISSSKKAWVDFDKFTQPLIRHLSDLGLNPELRSKSDIRVAQKKISGNASHIFKNRVMHHGSILVDTDLNLLSQCLKNTPSKYKNNSVQSRRSIVTNIANHLKSPLSISEFENTFIENLFATRFLDGEKTLSKNDLLEIKKLADEKYKTAEWNVLYNANYVFENTFLWQNRLTQISLKVKKGICETVSINGSLLKDIQNVIKNVPHETSVFQDVLKNYFTDEEVLRFFF